VKNNSIVRYLPITAEPPSLQDNTGDIDRLKKIVAANYKGRPVVVPFSRLAVVAQRFRDENFTGRAVLNVISPEVEIVDFVGDSPKVLAAMALDLGTTHLEATLIDLQSGKRLASANRENSQAQYGADILSRIHFAGRENGLQILHAAIVSDVNDLASSLAAEACVNISKIRGLSVSGNPTMVHLFLNITPHNLCREPYIPVVNYPDPFKAGELALAINPAAPVFVMPGVGSYFGGDLISGILSCGLDREEETCMLIDVGTNAEVVLGNKDWLIACAGAAGPALEGGVAKMGMRAAPGAIERVEVDKSSGEFICKTIGDEKPKGLCGSGLIDLVAALYLTRIIDSRGKFRKDAVGGRLSEAGEDQVFTVVPAANSSNQEAVVLGQVDLDALMRSKAAMYAILTTLVNQVGVEMDELHRIYVAGAFGRHIDPHQAITLGMLPDLPIEIYQPVGNSSLLGAELVLKDKDLVERCLQVVSNITYVELNVNQEFMLRFSGAKFIPHTDSTLFPSVPVFTD
jgi:uncharacterized 2Fe-2S/4Fe-4S cluster protein (DUF4445 family)